MNPTSRSTTPTPTPTPTPPPSPSPSSSSSPLFNRLPTPFPSQSPSPSSSPRGISSSPQTTSSQLTPLLDFKQSPHDDGTPLNAKQNNANRKDSLSELAEYPDPVIEVKPGLHEPLRRVSRCPSFGLSLCSGFPTALRTLFVVLTSNTVGLAIKTGLSTWWDGNASRGSRAHVAVVGVVVAAGATIYLGPRLKAMCPLEGSSRCAAAVRLAFGAAPVLIFGSLTFASTQIPSLDSKVMLFASAALGQVVGAIIRDVMTQHSKGSVPRLDVLGVDGEDLPGDSETRLAINRQRTHIATVFYMAISFAYFHYENNDAVKLLLGIDNDFTKTLQKGSLDRFNAEFLAGMPDNLRRVLAESLDDLCIAISIAIAVHRNGATLTLTPISKVELRKNFAPDSKAMGYALDAAAMRVLMGSVSTALKFVLDLVPGMQKSQFDTLKNAFRTAWAGFTERRGHYVELSNLRHLKEAENNPLSPAFVNLAVAKGATPIDMNKLGRKVVRDTERLQKKVVAEPFDVGTGTTYVNLKLRSPQGSKTKGDPTQLLVSPSSGVAAAGNVVHFGGGGEGKLDPREIFEADFELSDLDSTHLNLTNLVVPLEVSGEALKDKSNSVTLHVLPRWQPGVHVRLSSMKMGESFFINDQQVIFNQYDQNTQKLTVITAKNSVLDNISIRADESKDLFAYRFKPDSKIRINFKS